MPMTSVLYLSISLAIWADFPIDYNILTFQHPIFTLTFGLVNDVVSLGNFCLALIRKRHTVQINDVIIHWYLGSRLPLAISSTSWLLKFTSGFCNIISAGRVV